MARDGEVSVNLRITADTGGAAKASEGLRRVGDAARRSAADTRGGLEQMRAASGRVSGAFNALRSVLTGFGIGGVVMAVTGGLSKIVGSFGAAKKSAEDFRAIQSKLAEDGAVAGLANDYARLTDAVSAAAAAENHHLDMIDRQVAARRRLDAARLSAAHEDEIARLDPSAPDYDERRALVDRRYAALRAAAASGNAVEDLVLARQRTNAQADQTDAQASAQDAATKAIAARLAQARRAKSSADVEAVDLNAQDKTGALSAVGKTLGQLFTGDWGRMAGAKTAEGDQVRKAAAEKSAQYERQIRQLEEEKRRSEARAGELRRQAERLRERAGAAGADIEAAEIEGATARRSAARGERAARSALDRNHAAQATEAAKVADAEAASRALARQKAEIQAKIAAEQARKDAAGYAVYQAQGAADTARLGGNRRAQQAALGGLHAAQGAAQGVNSAADAAIAALTETLRSVESRLKAAQSFLQNQSKRQRNAWSEAPAGE